MLQKTIKKIFGSKNDRELKRIRPLVAQVGALEAQMKAMSDEELAAQTVRFRQRYTNGETLDEMLPEAFATAREAAVRTLGMRHYDVQLIGGIGLHEGKVVEMRTGEGKTLVATLPAYLNAISGKGVHVVTVNDYLARRDCEWMSRVYHFLGMTSGVITTETGSRKRAYAADITYGQNNELGFDYLRDNMKFSLDEYVHRYMQVEDEAKADKLFGFAIVDEVDSILIDEARTPLIISQSAAESVEPYLKANAVVPFLIKDLDYIVDEKAHSVSLTEAGVDKVEARLKIGNLYDPEHMEWVHYIHTALKAHALYRADVNYMVEDGKVIIIDEHTGRKMPGRRWSDGLHQSVEAKEGLRIQQETRTAATITFQNYFRMYEKLSGMTGTAETEAEEFAKIYDLDVLVVPTNKPIAREDHEDLVYKTERGKFKAVIEQIKECHGRGQPVLVGTISVEKSGFLASKLAESGIHAHVLNAKQHQREAEIVAQAGRYGSVTIATNMAGRGTDIVLGGNPEALAGVEVFDTADVRDEHDTDSEEFQAAFARYKAQCDEEKQRVLAAGGLAVIGTERHESRRIDNQLRGRSGRQGDPGMSQFYLSLEDDLMRIFNGEQVRKIMEWLKIPEDEPIVAKSVTKAIENAQRRVEGQHFDARKNLLEYDDVMNMQRKSIYALRRKVLASETMVELLGPVIADLAFSLVDGHCSQGINPGDWDIEGLEEAIYGATGLDLDLSELDRDFDTIEEAVSRALTDEYHDRRDRIIETIFQDVPDEQRVAGEEQDPEALEAHWREQATKSWVYFERETYLKAIDGAWTDHLRAMDALREGVFLNAYAQKDPKLIYKKEGYTAFQDMIARVQGTVAEQLLRVQVKSAAELEQSRKAAEERRARLAAQRSESHADGSAVGKASAATGGSGAAASADGESPQQPAQPTKVETFRRDKPKLGRNDPCWCGSGKKYKKCHMAKDEAEERAQRQAAPAP